MEILDRPIGFRVGQALAALALTGIFFDAGEALVHVLDVIEDGSKIVQLDRQYAGDPTNQYYQGLRRAVSDDRDTTRADLSDVLVWGDVYALGTLGTAGFLMYAYRHKETEPDNIPSALTNDATTQ